MEWKTETLGNIAFMTSGGTPSKKNPEYYKGGTIPWVRSGELENGAIRDTEIKITQAGLDASSAKIFPKGTLLIALYGATIGKLAYLDIDACTNQAVCGIFANDKVSLKFLYFFLLFHRSDLVKQGVGGAQPNISQTILKKLIVSYPVNRAEQLRIVARIEELFSKLDASVAELKTAKEKLKVYRQAVLKEALTPEQGWCKCCFSDLMESVRNGYGKKPDDMGEYRILRISSVRPGKVELSDFRCNQTPFKEDDLISENDLLFTRYNGSLEYVGVCACVPQLQEKYAYPDKIIKCTPKLKNPYHSRFLQYSMNQGEARKYIRSKIKTTSGQKGIAGSDIKKVVLWLPELPVQEKIVKMIDEKMSTCDNIEQTIDISLRQAEAMRQSILKHAFKGGL